MNEPTGSDFFGALALELRAAGQRRPRRAIAAGQAVAALAAIALMAVAVLIIQLIAGGQPANRSAVHPDPVGTVIPKGDGEPPRQRRSTVVATGTARGIGPWQLEASRSTRLADPESGEVYQPAGLRCLTIYPLDPPDGQMPGAHGQCGEFPRTRASAGFSSANGRCLSMGACRRAPEPSTFSFPAGARSARGSTRVRRAAAETSTPWR